MRLIRHLSLLPLLALAACINLGLGNAKTPDSLFTLTAANAPAAGSGASGNLASALSVLEPRTGARLAVLRVPVQIDDSRVAYLQKAIWVERPSRLFQRLLAETLRARGNRLVVEGDETTHGTILSGRLMDIGYDARTKSVVVAYDAIRENPGGKIDTRRFERFVRHVNADPREVGPALNVAANAVAKDVADWIG